MSSNASFQGHESSASQNQSANTPIAGAMVTLPSADSDITYATATTPLLPISDQTGSGDTTITMTTSVELPIKHERWQPRKNPSVNSSGVRVQSSQPMAPTMAQLSDIGDSKVVPPPSSASGGRISGPSCKRKRTEKLGVDMLNTTLGQGSNLNFSGPAIVRVNPNEDVVEKIRSFVEEKGSIVILFTTGTLSFVQLLQQDKIATFEGEFHILSFSGTINLPKEGERHRIGEMSISVSGSGDRVFGGRVQGRLIAGSVVEIVGGFITQSTRDSSELRQRQKGHVKERKHRAKKTNQSHVVMLKEHNGNGE